MVVVGRHVQTEWWSEHREIWILDDILWVLVNAKRPCRFVEKCRVANTYAEQHLHHFVRGNYYFVIHHEVSFDLLRSFVNAACGSGC